MLSSNTLREYIQNDLLTDPALTIADDQDLLISGLLDSLNVVRLVSFIEQQCNIEIPPEDVVLEHFGSLNQITSYLETRS